MNRWLSYGSEGMFEHSQLFGGTWPWAYAALCFSCGYFAYDQWDMLQYQLYSGWIPAILVHHLVLLICFTLALYRNVTINYLILTLICEVCISFFLQDVPYEYAAFFLYVSGPFWIYAFLLSPLTWTMATSPLTTLTQAQGWGLQEFTTISDLSCFSKKRNR